jgi:hypothetical protein
MSNDEKSADASDDEGPPATNVPVPLPSRGEVVVTHVDLPPPRGRRPLQPRRPAPLVPQRDDAPDPPQGPKPPDKAESD